MDWKKNLLPVLLIGLAWPFFGLGYQAIQIRYIPEGISLVSQGLGLFLAGAVSGELLLALIDKMDQGMARVMILAGYLLFAPLGVLSALAASIPFEPAVGESWSAGAVAMPIMAVVAASVPIAFGMNLTRFLALAVRRAVAVRA